VQGQSVTLRASAFSDPDGDRHLESHWQITTVQGDYTAPLVDAWGNKTRARNIFQDTDTQSGADITTYTAFVGLNQTYYWRVRYRDEHLGWSQWSEEASFSTVPVPPWAPASVVNQQRSAAGSSPSRGLALQVALLAVPFVAVLSWKRCKGRRPHTTRRGPTVG